MTALLRHESVDPGISIGRGAPPTPMSRRKRPGRRSAPQGTRPLALCGSLPAPGPTTAHGPRD
eukprot:11174804-Lingulodinium_polyedra.AAC.1